MSSQPVGGRYPGLLMDRQQDNPKPSLAFARFLEGKTKSGKDGQGHPKDYVPLCVLQQYWTPQKIRDVQNACRPPAVFDVDSIRNKFLRVLSLLVLLEKVAYFEEFSSNRLSDNHFPLNKYPIEWPPDSHAHHRLYETIEKRQWMFFPLIFDSDLLLNQNLPIDRILPITKERQISDSGTTRVCEITIDKFCNNLDNVSATFVQASASEPAVSPSITTWVVG
jgi:hypothetical protein